MAKQVLDPHLQGQRGRRATGASALHVEIDDATVKTVEGDITAVLRHGRVPLDVLRRIGEEWARA